jgi:hypothetical protein
MGLTLTGEKQQVDQLPESSPEADHAGGVTRRAVGIAVAITVATMPAAFLTEIVWGKGQWGTGAPAAWPITVLVILAALMGFRAFRRTGLTRRELLVVYSIVLVGVPLMSRTVLFYAVPKAIIYYYAARQNPLWETTFIRYIPWWFAPRDYVSIEGFFLGGPVPWARWAVPLAAWYSVMLAMFGASFCLITLIQRQWVSHERLAFPLAQIPLETVRDPGAREGGKGGRLVLSSAFWIGVMVSGVLNVLSKLGDVYPALPTVPVNPLKVIERQGVGPLTGLGALYLNFSPVLLGIVYIIPKELSFSCWFFWVLRLIAHVLAITAGVTPQEPESWGNDFPAPWQAGTGATIAFGLWAFWIARRHLGRVLHVLVMGRSRDEGDDPALYRLAVFGFAVCFAWLLVFCWLAGCRPIFALVLVSVVVGTFLVWARVRADTALEPCVTESYAWILAPINGQILRPQEIVTMISMRWATFPVASMIFSAPVMNSLDTFKIAESARINPRRLAWAILGSFALVLAVGMTAMLAGIYHYGYYGTQSGAAPYWPSLYNRLDGGMITNLINNPAQPDWKTMIGMVSGGVFCILLGMMRLRFWWWPFHPVGFIVAMGYGLASSVVPFVLGWAAKSLVIRYGGLHTYRKTVPLAIGAIVGGLFSTSFWSLAALVTHGAGGPPNY